MRITSQVGVSLVEVIIGVTIVTAVLGGIGFAIETYIDTRATLLEDAKSAYLAEEGYEIVRHLRNESWSTISAVPVDTTRYLSVSTTTLAISTTPEIIDGNFRRSFKLQSVYRNGSDDIVAPSDPGATLDSDARELEMSVAGPHGTTTYEAIITNLFDI